MHGSNVAQPITFKDQRCQCYKLAVSVIDALLKLNFGCTVLNFQVPQATHS